MLPELNSLDSHRSVAIHALNALRQLLPKADRDNGMQLGVFALVDPKYECPADLLELDMFWVFGSANEDEKRRFKMYVYEKALRLAYYIRQTNSDAVSGFQGNRSRDARRYAGAIRVRYRVPELGQGFTSLIFSPSGYGELADEAFALGFASTLPWEMEDRAVLRQIANISSNELGRKLLAA